MSTHRHDLVPCEKQDRTCRHAGAYLRGPRITIALLIAPLIMFDTLARADRFDEPDVQRNRLVLGAAMTPSAESVVLWDYIALTHADSSLRDMARRKLEKLGQVPEGNDPNNIKYVILRHIARSGPLLQVKGGSDFASSADSSSINFNTRAIWLVRDSFAPLRKLLDDGKEITGRITTSTFLEVTVYESEIQIVLNSDQEASIRENRFVAFPDDRIVLVAETRADINHMIHATTTKTTSVSDRWAWLTESPRPYNPPQDPLGESALGGPIVICRWFQVEAPDNSAAPEWHRRIPVTALHLVLPCAKRPRFFLKVSTPNPDAAVRFFKKLFPESDYRWETSLRADQFSAHLEFRHTEGEPPSIQLIVGFLFGNKRLEDIPLSGGEMAVPE